MSFPDALGLMPLVDDDVDVDGRATGWIVQPLAITAMFSDNQQQACCTFSTTGRDMIKSERKSKSKASDSAIPAKIRFKLALRTPCAVHTRRLRRRRLFERSRLADANPFSVVSFLDMDRDVRAGHHPPLLFHFLR